MARIARISQLPAPSHPPYLLQPLHAMGSAPSKPPPRPPPPMFEFDLRAIEFPRPRDEEDLIESTLRPHEEDFIKPRAARAARAAVTLRRPSLAVSRTAAASAAVPYAKPGAEASGAPGTGGGGYETVACACGKSVRTGRSFAVHAVACSKASVGAGEYTETRYRTLLEAYAAGQRLGGYRSGGAALQGDCTRMAMCAANLSRHAIATITGLPQGHPTDAAAPVGVDRRYEDTTTLYRGRSSVRTPAAGPTTCVGHQWCGAGWWVRHDGDSDDFFLCVFAKHNCDRGALPLSGNGSGTHDTSLRDAVDAAVASNPSAPVKSVHATVIKDPAHSLASVEAVRHHVNNAMARLSAHRRPLAGEPSNATLLGLLEQFLEEDTFAFVKPVGANVPLRLSPRPPGGTSHGDIAAHSFMSIASAGVPVDACVAVLTCRRGLDDLAEVTQVATDEVNNFLQVGEPDAPMLLVTAFPEGRPPASSQ